MNKEKEFLLWFEQMERGDVAIVGGKSSSLGEMTSKTDVPVPYGFATTAYVYRYFIEKSDIKKKMQAILAELTDVENSALLRDVSARLREAIMAEEMPEDLKAAIAAAYEELGKKVGEAEPYVAVRSSAWGTSCGERVRCRGRHGRSRCSLSYTGNGGRERLAPAMRF